MDGPITGVVRLVERLGNETLATIETTANTVATVSLDGKSDIAVGATMRLGVAPSEALAFNEQGLAV